MLCGTDMRRVLPPLTGLAMLAALVLVFLLVPTEADMGIVQRIFYFHVSSAWVAFLGFFLVAGASAVYLWNGSRAADRLAEAAGGGRGPFCTPVPLTGAPPAAPILGGGWAVGPRPTMTRRLWG